MFLAKKPFAEKEGSVILASFLRNKIIFFFFFERFQYCCIMKLIISYSELTTREQTPPNSDIHDAGAGKIKTMEVVIKKDVSLPEMNIEPFPLRNLLRNGSSIQIHDIQLNNMKLKDEDMKDDLVSFVRKLYLFPCVAGIIFAHTCISVVIDEYYIDSDEEKSIFSTKIQNVTYHMKRMVPFPPLVQIYNRVTTDKIMGNDTKCQFIQVNERFRTLVEDLNENLSKHQCIFGILFDKSPLHHEHNKGHTISIRVDALKSINEINMVFEYGPIQGVPIITSDKVGYRSFLTHLLKTYYGLTAQELQSFSDPLEHLKLWVNTGVENQLVPFYLVVPKLVMTHAYEVDSTETSRKKRKMGNNAVDLFEAN